MTLSELMKAVGDETIQWQLLSSGEVGITVLAKDSKVTFYTDRDKGQSLANFLASGKQPTHLCLVVWLPYEKAMEVWPKC